MATIQAKTSRGHKYWYIVESRRVNGKPRPIVLAYLGKAETLLKRLQGIVESIKVKSYSHGAVAALLQLAGKLDVVPLINRHIRARRHYMAEKPTRNRLTAGMTLLLAAIGRVCMPTSKRGWWDWAKGTSCEYLLRVSLSQVDSQHFWDLMDCLPEQEIEKAELELLQNVRDLFDLDSSSLLYDTTNFYTFIDSGNVRCRIAQRGKNKQKRYDLRQVNMALVVTRQDYIPIFHHTYRGNLNDSTIFAEVINSVKKRMTELGLDLAKHTLVFDRGCNSKNNLAHVKQLKLHYVGALTPSHHKDLIRDAETSFTETQVGDTMLQLYRDRRFIWGEDRTVVVFISEKLKAGQLRGVYQALEKRKKQLSYLQQRLTNPRAQKKTRPELEEKINNLLKGQFMEGLINYNLTEIGNGRFSLTYGKNESALDTLEDRLGFRILMTDRHHWKSADIVQAYYGQSAVEQAFKNIKNPYHLAVTPEFHWTDQKIKVHYFSCVLGYLLASLIAREARLKAEFAGTLDSLLDTLNSIRLATIIDQTGKRGKLKATYRIEELSDEEKMIVEALNLMEVHTHRPKIKGVGVYA